MSTVAKSTADWVGSVGTSAVAWGVPKVAIVAALFTPTHVRAAVWVAALLWMGTACILNSRRCGRIHCRYTGPYYLAIIAPVILLASALVTVDFYIWLALAALIVFGGWIIWWATERAWGKFS